MQAVTHSELCLLVRAVSETGWFLRDKLQQAAFCPLHPLEDFILGLDERSVMFRTPEKQKIHYRKKRLTLFKH